jgi:hypothetical protein
MEECLTCSGGVKIQIQRNETSQPIVYENAVDAYTKGPMYCVLLVIDGQRVTHKYPLASLFRVVEDYPVSMRETRA